MSVNGNTDKFKISNLKSFSSQITGIHSEKEQLNHEKELPNKITFV